MPAACGRGYDFKPAWFDAVKAARLKRFRISGPRISRNGSIRPEFDKDCGMHSR
jgi:hypothetical protein